MLSGMTAAIVAIAITALLPALPPPGLLALPPLVSLPLLLSRRAPARIVACALLGFAFGCWRAHQLLDRQFPQRLHGAELPARICVQGLPERRVTARGVVWRFEALLLDPAAKQTPLSGWSGRRLELSHYADAGYRPGETYDLRLRLRRPRGFVNPGSRDYQAWQLARGIHATGYVVGKAAAQRVSDERCSAPVPRLRLALRDALDAHLGSRAHVDKLLALAIGDDSRISAADWDTLASSGTTHLMVISGMHISLLGWLAMHLGGMLVRRAGCLPALWPAQKWGLLLALPLCAAYALLAGFSVPAQRALIMISCFICFALADRVLRPWLGYVAALLAVLLLEPLAVLQRGFWLSFCVVAALIFTFSGRIGAMSRLQYLWRPQLVALLALACPLLLAGLTPAPLSPLANALAIPLVSLLVLPLTLLGCALLLPLPALAVLPLELALWLLDVLWPCLAWVARHSPVVPALSGAAAWWTLLLAGFATLWLLAPRGVPARALAVLCLLPLLVPREQQAGLLEVLMLDVGQGTAVILRTRSRVLVYDAGPNYSERFDAGEHIVVPALRRLGVRAVDMLVLSHADGDHAGGAHGLLASVPVTTVMGGEPLAGIDMDACIAGQQWQWDGVHFEFLHPAAGSRARGNERSCVLRVEAAGRTLLLAGDIEAGAERALLRDPSALRADLLLVPHHGSRTSSTVGFVRSVRPRFALVSAGYRNRFGHPHPGVQQRYREVGAGIVNTANEGAVLIRIGRDGSMSAPLGRRRAYRRWWYD